MTEFYETRTEGQVEDVKTRLEAELKKREFGVLHLHDIKATLDEKGVGFETPLLILDVCNPGYAKQALQATDNRIAPLLPCSIALWQEGEDVVIRLVRPTTLAGFFPGRAGLAQLALEVETKILAAIGEVIS